MCDLDLMDLTGIFVNQSAIDNSHHHHQH